MAEVEFKEAFRDISKKVHKRRGRRLENAIIGSLRELQKRFDEIILFDVDNDYNWTLSQDFFNAYNVFC